MKHLSRSAVGLGLAMLGTLACAQYQATFVEYNKGWGTAIADYNNDGHDDLFIVGHDTDDRIWFWTPTGYQRSNQSWELKPHSDRHDCAPADVDLDGRIDVYCAVGAKKGKGTGANELWMGQADGTHKLITTKIGAKDLYGRSRRPIFFDLNRDGWPDIFLTNYGIERVDGEPNINKVFLNNHDSTFTLTRTVATGAFGSMCVAKGDIDGDGWDDVVVCSDQPGPPHIYLNDHHNDFTLLAPPTGRISAPLQQAPQRPSRNGASPEDINLGDWNDVKLADMDGDGRDDMVIVTKDNLLQIWRNSGVAPYYTEVMLEEQFSVVASGVAIGDFNHDGRKDLYVVLRDAACERKPDDQKVDLAPDVWYASLPSGGWQKVQLDQPDYRGCGHMADVLDGDRLVLVNGGIAWFGNNYVLQLQ